MEMDTTVAKTEEEEVVVLRAAIGRYNRKPWLKTIQEGKEEELFKEKLGGLYQGFKKEGIFYILHLTPNLTEKQKESVKEVLSHFDGFSSFSFSRKVQSREPQQLIDHIAQNISRAREFADYKVCFGGMNTVMKSLDMRQVFNTLSDAVGKITGKPAQKKPTPKTLLINVEYGEQVTYVSFDSEKKPQTAQTEKKEHEVLICHFDEAYLKKGNKYVLFYETIQNMSQKCNHLPGVKIHLDHNLHSVVTPGDASQIAALQEIFLKVPGISVVETAITTTADAESITAEALKHLAKRTFAKIQLEVKVYEKKLYKKSEELRTLVKAALEKELKVPIIYQTDADVRIKIYVTKKGGYIAHSKVKGMGGLPVLNRQTVVVLLSGGIDSPVAAYQMMKRGCRVILVHFQNQNQMETAVKDKIVKLAEHLSNYQSKTLLYIVPFAECQQDIIEKVAAEERMLVYRRFMTQIASAIAFKHNACFLVTGDSMSQVASQTIRNLEAIYRTTPVPILAPLIGMNKTEIIQIALQIGTHDISQLPYGDCCSYFLSKHPALHLRQTKEALKVLDSVAKQFDLRQIGYKGIRESQILSISKPGEIEEVQKMAESAMEFQKKAAENAVCVMDTEKTEDVNEDELTDEQLQAELKRSVDLRDFDDVKEETSPLEESVLNGKQEEIEQKLVSKRKRDESDSEDMPKSKRTSLTFTITPNDEYVYLDNAASTKVDEEVVKAMIPFYLNDWANSHSAHSFGKRVSAAIERSRKIIADSIGAKEHEIIFTGSGTEANNLAIIGTVKAFLNSQSVPSRYHVITTAIEHESVLQPFRQLSKMGVDVTFMSVNSEGFVTAEQLKRYLKSNTILVSVCHGNNEIGTIQNLQELGKICRENGTLFHTDACQSFTKTELDVNKQFIDLATLNAHKIHGPKGVGALYIRTGVTVDPQMLGGNHERNLRAGTVNTPGIVGFATAVEVAMKNSAKIAKMSSQCEYLFNKLREHFPTLAINGPPIGPNRLCNNLSLYLPQGMEGDQVAMYLSKRKICCSTGSACSSDDMQASHVIVAIGRNAKDALRTVRFSLSKYTTADDLDAVIQALSVYNSKITFE